ncbi:MAG: M67 family metallopeptidase [Gammaproteobacteria bacterium]|nr:M67 family metallopeptidase [Gammaproteobacteria bacterium]
MRHTDNIMNTISIPRTLANQILTQAQQHPDTEACGLVSAHDGQPNRVYPVQNVAKDPQHLFEMDPANLISSIKDIRNQGNELFAIYHSHPETPALPSATDLAQSGYPDSLYLIVSLNTKGVLEMRGFYLRQQQIEDVELVVE